MIIYSKKLEKFRDDILNNEIVNEINLAFKNIGHKPPSKSEQNSWKSSLMYVNNIFLNPEFIFPMDVNIYIEYKIPLTGKRIDVLISGKDEDYSNIVIMELKQWEKVEPIDDPNTVAVKTFVGKGIRSAVHPSYQSWSYKELILNNVIEVQNQSLIK